MSRALIREDAYCHERKCSYGLRLNSMRQLLREALVLCIVLISATLLHSSTCPCQDAEIEVEHYYSQLNGNLSSGALTLCVANARNAERDVLRQIVLHDIDIQFVQNVSAKCNVLVKIGHSSNPNHNSFSRRQLCPGICRPIPEIRIMSKWLEMGVDSMTQNSLLSCTLTTSMLKSISSSSGVVNDRSASAGNSSTSLRHVANMLRAIFWRRIMECYESKIWRSRHTQYTSFSVTDGHPDSVKREDHVDIARRKVSSIVIWIGSQDQIKLIEEQASVLKQFPFFDETAVIGWAATDESYPCRDSKVKCLSKGRMKCLPQSAINYMSTGWGCAQRRPLRSLAHTLLLVEPSFAVVLDGDTFLNYKLLLYKYGSYLTQGAMVQRPLAMGELLGTWGDTGHLTKWGIYAGGAGYIIGRKALEALVAYEIKYYKGEGVGSRQQDVDDSDLFRSNQQIFHLSVYREGYEMSSKHCSSRATLGSSRVGDSSGDSCVLSTKPVVSSLNSTMHGKEMKRNFAIQIAVRLIDFCANLLANENTCLHRWVTLDFRLSCLVLCFVCPLLPSAKQRTHKYIEALHRQPPCVTISSVILSLIFITPCPLLLLYSDHSMGRCLVYGAFIDPVSSACHSTAQGGSPTIDPLDPTDPTGVKVRFYFSCNEALALILSMSVI